MLSVIAAAMGLVVFFSLVLYLCVRDRKQQVYAGTDSGIELMRKSPLGRWRY